MKNHMVSIGYTGIKRCYLNIPLKEAIKRYLKTEEIKLSPDFRLADAIPPELILEFDFEDEFRAYDIWEE